MPSHVGNGHSACRRFATRGGAVAGTVCLHTAHARRTYITIYNNILTYINIYIYIYIFIYLNDYILVCIIFIHIIYTYDIVLS